MAPAPVGFPGENEKECNMCDYFSDVPGKPVPQNHCQPAWYARVCALETAVRATWTDTFQVAANRRTPADLVFLTNMQPGEHIDLRVVGHAETEAPIAILDLTVPRLNQQRLLGGSFAGEGA